MPDETPTPDPLALCGAIDETVAEYATEGEVDLAGRFAVYAFSLDGYNTLDEDAQEVCRDFATWVRRERTAVTQLLSAAAVELRRLVGERDNWNAVVKDICEEWSEANGATCNPTCSSYGHDADCKATGIAAYLRSLRAAHEALRGAQEDSVRLDAKPDRQALFAGVHPVLYHSVMDAIERTVIVCDKHEREEIPREGREVDYAGILCAAVSAALAAARAGEPNDHG